VNFKTYISSGLAFCFLIFVVGCATSHLNLSSNPSKAKVELISPEDKVTMELGETPLLLTHDQLAAKQPRGPYLLRVRKEGFADREILLLSLSGMETQINLELRSNEPTKALNGAIDGLFRAQELAQNGNYQSSLETLSELQKEHPQIAAIYEIRGSVHMVQGEYAAAAKDLEKAVEFDPENASVRQLYETASQRAGSDVRMPASEKPKAKEGN
jgi:tetratricopeptide (TPR) repeat protein